MAFCRSCGTEGRRIVTTFEIAGRPLPEPKDSCPSCSPADLGRWQDPSNKHGCFSWQMYPEQYNKRILPDGMVFYEAKDERNADLEAKIAREPDDERLKREKAYDEKRKTRRTRPLSKAEIDAMVARARASLETAEAKAKREFNEAVNAMGATSLVH